MAADEDEVMYIFVGPSGASPADMIEAARSGGGVKGLWAAVVRPVLRTTFDADWWQNDASSHPWSALARVVMLVLAVATLYAFARMCWRDHDPAPALTEYKPRPLSQGNKKRS